jgi:hypothetical protein
MYLYSTPNVQTKFILETPDYDTEPVQLVFVSHEV